MSLWNPRILVIGAGAGGIAAAAGLLQDGYRDLLVVDRADGVGGVWRANSYPGAQCDVPSHLYSFSFHHKADWRRRFADRDEILDYLEEVVTRYGLGPYLRFTTEVVECNWDDTGQLWRVRLRAPGGTETVREADVVIAATGQLSAPAVPRIPGLDRFAGPVFHSARWRHDVDLSRRRVGVIGTGASAIQFVLPVAETAAHVTVFQRSAPYIIGKPNRAYSSWLKKLFASVPAVQRASRLRQYLWFELLGVAFTTMPGVMRLPTRAWHRRLRRTVPDPELRAKVAPDYLMGCKRLLRAPDWYRTLSRPDVTLVTDPIAEIRPDGLRTADGVVHPLDVLILGTGFKATEFLTPIRVTGRGGRDLAAMWQGGARAYLGTAVSGFPNLFLLYGPGTNLGHSSILFMIESQIAWIRSAIAAMRSHQLRWIDVRPQVQDRYDRWFTTASAGTVWETGCSSWYTRNGHNTNNWPGTTVAFRRRTRRFQLADVESIRTQGANVPPTAEPATVKGLPESTLRAEHLAALPADVPAAPWECRARALIWWQRATAPDFDWQGRPVPLAVAGFVEYLDTPVGPYHEVLAGNLLWTGRLPVSQVPFIAVDSLASVAGGRANWALPKTMADFEVDLASATARAEGDGWSVAVRPVSAPPRSPGRLPIRLRSSATGPLGRYPTSLRATGRLVRVHTRAEGQTLAGWLGHGPRWAVLLTGRLRVGEPRP